MARDAVKRAVRPVVGDPAPALGRWLAAEGAVPPDALLRGLRRLRLDGGRLDERVLAQAPDPARTAAALARYHGLRLVDPRREPGDAALLARADAAFCLREGVMPWRSAGAAVVVLCARPDGFAGLRPRLEQMFGPVVPAYAPAAAIEAAILSARGADLAARAERRVPADLSCRGFSLLRHRLALLAGGGGLALATAGWPGLVLAVLTLFVTLTLVLTTLMKLAATIAALSPRLPVPAPPVVARLPRISVMVALHREANIAARLVARLSRLDYPRDLLEVLLVVEENDRMTRNALALADLPGWMRVVAVPDGAVRTKPRALNHALDQCHGSIVGVYDAEDAPAPDQLHRVVQRFHERGPETVCLQGRLDFYNPTTNWMARCFTMEYAAWFRLVLPGFDRLGLPVPLGGTTLFFRREALEDLGGWDAWNVTEDADLGLRLMRRGWRTEVIDTTTGEEANCRPLAWVKQRSRWIKGYMMTWIVHMRDPARLWRELGPKAFLAFQVHFLGSITQALLAPLLWSWWVIAADLPHPVAPVLPSPVVMSCGALFLLAQATDLLIVAIALRQSRQPIGLAWVPVIVVYHMLAVPAAWKAARELVTRPFYWDKTTHGLFG